ncbi:DUF2634 domain-containing protein [Paenibacillus sp. 1-18]|uniref:DUF2634 domain-containing protein n=1 Tax=Paenibacillus sp. 1-18 TaxID=1333846 RepID=UPI000471CDA5|nr:DUF2634 domain-containing protein [Paenibacillus sp. 1-18]
MIPEGGSIVDEEIEEEEMPTKTYALDFTNGRARGIVDGLEAMRQVVYKILQTLRYENLIYSDDYGAEIDRLQGQSRLFVQTELKRLVREALLADDRITDVRDFQFTFNGSDVLAEFEVITTQGNFRDETGVGGIV